MPDSMPSWSQLCELEPRLEKLHSDALRYKRAHPKTDNLNVWYRLFKPRVSDLVGYEAAVRGELSWLWTSYAYDLVYHKVLNTLR